MVSATVKVIAYKSCMRESDRAVSVIAITTENLPFTMEAEAYTAMSGVEVESCADIGGGENVGYIDTGDWMDYTITVTAGGTYSTSYRVKGWDGGAQLELIKDGNVLAATGTNTGDVWATVTSGTFNLPEGTYTVRINASGGRFNLNWIMFTPLV